MKNDFVLFPVSDSGEDAVDADIALITAYLSRELSPVQIVAVQDRLDSDREFRERVRPIIEMWTVRGSLLQHESSPAATMPSSASLLGADEIDAGWTRYAMNAPAHDARRTPIKLQDASSPTRSRTMLFARAAAVIAVIVIPMFATAQIMRHIAGNADAPGHAIVRGLVPHAWRAPIEPSALTLAMAEGEIAMLDTPVQHSLPLAQQSGLQAVPVVDLPPAAFRTTRPLRSILGIKHTDEGRVLVNDPLSRQVLLFERDLATSTAVLDSVPGAKSYGTVHPDRDNAATWRVLRPFVGDSAVFMFLPGAFNMRSALVLDAHGNVVRGIELDPFTVGESSDTFWDQQGRPVSLMEPWPKSFVASIGPNAYSSIPFRSDTLNVTRIANLTTRRVDTVGTINLPDDQRPATAGPRNPQGVGNGGGKLAPVTGADGVVCTWETATAPGSGRCRNTAKQVINPLYFVDSWALLSDGTIGFVRGSDYHVDWIHPDGAKSSSEKLPHDWKPLSAADKVRIIDSTRAAIDSLDALALVIEDQLKPWKDSVAQVARAAGARAINQELRHAGPPVRYWPYEIVTPSQIADHYPPMRPNAAKADADGNLWILPRMTSLSRQGELVYDVVNPTRGLAQRVRLPLGRAIAGFGKGGVVYLQHGDLKSGFFLERSVLIAPLPK